MCNKTNLQRHFITPASLPANVAEQVNLNKVNRFTDSERIQMFPLGRTSTFVFPGRRPDILGLSWRVQSGSTSQPKSAPRSGVRPAAAPPKMNYSQHIAAPNISLTLVPLLLIAIISEALSADWSPCSLKLVAPLTALTCSFLISFLRSASYFSFWFALAAL